MDTFVLTGPHGSQVNVGSWVDPSNGGVDFGAQDLLKSVYGQNSLAEGGELAYESLGVRTFRFPLLVSAAAAIPSGLTGAEAWLRELARSGGAYVDVLVEGTPTADAIRFDVINGRWEPGYSLYHNRAGRRAGTLFLDVQ